MSYIETNAVERLSRDLAKGAATMSTDEARFLVDYYYTCQNDRIRFHAQTRALDKSQKPNMVLGWLAIQAETLENQVKRALDKHTDEHTIGKWIKSLYGFGPVLAAGFVAHIDITKAPTAGHIWSYAGLVNGQVWQKGQKRPWNAELKKLCWKAGECMVKFSNKEECVYGQIFKDRKIIEWENNVNGSLRSTVEAQKDRYSKNTDAWPWVNGCYKADVIYELIQTGQYLTPDVLRSLRGEPGSGDLMIPPAHVHARARRYAMKLFLSHLHEVWYEHHFKRRVPNPFVIEHLGHTHRIQVPGYDSPYAGGAPSFPFKATRSAPKPNVDSAVEYVRQEGYRIHISQDDATQGHYVLIDNQNKAVEYLESLVFEEAVQEAIAIIDQKKSD